MARATRLLFAAAIMLASCAGPPAQQRDRAVECAAPESAPQYGILELTLTDGASYQQLQGEADAYDGAITYLDEHLGQLFEELQQRGIADNTLVLLTADHGESFGEHGLLTHQNALYRELIRVPLIVRWPGRVPAGVRVTQPVSTAALAATVMDLLIGSAEPALFPGPSLSQLWRDPDGHRDWPYPLAELAHIPSGPPQRPAFHGATKSLVRGHWHYVVHETLGAELYDWEADPREEHNLVARPEMQDMVRDFESHPQLRQALKDDRN